MIILIGYMASGKSTVGQLVASKRAINFTDLDLFIQEKENDSIENLINKKGIIWFRKAESQYLNALLRSTPQESIIALGGGTPAYGDIMEQLKSISCIKLVYLKASVKSLSDRLYGDEQAHRPLLSHINSKVEMTEFIGKHLFERSPIYESAHSTIITDHLSMDQTAAALAALF